MKTKDWYVIVLCLVSFVVVIALCGFWALKINNAERNCRSNFLYKFKLGEAAVKQQWVDKDESHCVTQNQKVTRRKWWWQYGASIAICTISYESHTFFRATFITCCTHYFFAYWCVEKFGPKGFIKNYKKKI
jgi:hypothetical protein